MSDRTLSTVAVLGAGTMGHGIAHVAAAAGYDTILFDVSADAVQAGLDRVRKNLDKFTPDIMQAIDEILAS